MSLAARSRTAAARWTRSNRSKVLALLLAVVLGVGFVPVLQPSPSADAAAPGFTDNVMFSSGLLGGPTSIQFSSDGRVFVAQKSGEVVAFDSLSDSTPDLVIDLRTQVHNFWDRGLLGFALSPNFPADPYAYVSYAHDAAIGGTAPRWGSPGVSSDPCPDPPGANDDGCVISGRLSRFQITGNTAGPEQVLIEDWCAQFPSHTIGDLKFGPDGSLYVSGGDGASFNYVDYGQTGGNVCSDYPGDTNLDPEDSRGGALRSQKVITDGVPVSLDGTILRVDPATGQGMPGNPHASSADPNARRIVATGLRNPFRFAVRPGTSELYIGDVGWNAWEEINVVDDANDGVADNFGWPCYEGSDVQGGYAALSNQLCDDLYAAGTAKAPFYNYLHGPAIVPGDGCPNAGGSSITGISFNDNRNNYPAEYDGAMYFTDLQHQCIWVMFAGPDGRPDPSTVQHFMNAENPVYLTPGPDGDLWYADLIGGRLHRISYGTSAPTECPDGQYVAEYFNNQLVSGTPAVARCETIIDNDWGTAAPLPGVNVDGFSVRWTTTRTLVAGTYEFTATVDDGVRVFIDGVPIIDQWHDGPATTYTASRTLTAGEHEIRVQYYDNGLSAVAKFSYTSPDGGGNSAPTAIIASPTTATMWTVGDTINFSGSATDPEDDALPASALTWRVSMLHCPDLCHEHVIQSFPGVTSGSFVAPDHDYPSKIQVQLTATDSLGASNTATTVIDPQTATLRFESVPSGLRIAHGSTQAVTPFEHTVIINSANSITAPTPQTLGGTSYDWTSWSDGSPRSHNVTAAPGTTTLTATFTASGPGDPETCSADEFRAEYFNNITLSGTPVFTRCEAMINNDWGTSSPGPGVNVDGFSVRWTGSPTFAAGSHVFSTTADDGVRVFVDGTALIDQWHDQGPTTYTGSRTLTAGTHPVVMEFYEAAGGALARLSWTNLGDPGDPGGGDCPAGQFLAEFFNNVTLSGTPVLSRCEATIDSDFGVGSPGAGVNADGFSVRWTGSPVFTAGEHMFSTTADDGVRIFVDATSLIDQWHDQGPTTYTATRTMTAGAHAVRMEFYEAGGGALARLSWVNTGGGTNQQPTATITSPVSSTQWAPGEAISFAGSATDPEDGALPATSLSWRVLIEHCEGAECHEHVVDTFEDVAGGTFTPPDHEYPSRLKFELTAADSLGEVHAVTTVLEQEPPEGGCAADQFQAEYFNNITMSGGPVLTRCEAAINNDWGGSPGPGVNADGFSVRWMGTPTFAAGEHLFSTTADDGVRVFVDGTSLIDQWHDQGPTTYTASRTLTAGTHSVRMEFYEAGGGATARLSWTNLGDPGDPGDPGGCPLGQFQAEYFNNMTMSGTPVLTRCEATIDNDWGLASPAPGVNADGFSVRWTGTPTFAAGEHLFSTTADDGVRVFVDGALLINEWHDQGPTTHTATRSMTAGAHTVRMEYFENGVGAMARLSWAATGTGPNEAPTASIVTPTSATMWTSGQPVAFSGTATDPEDGSLPASGLHWRVSLLTCPDVCTEQLIATFDGVASGSFVPTAPAAPSLVRIELTATDSGALDHTVTQLIAPEGACPVGQFLAEYFNNMTLSGTPVLTRCEATIDNDWGGGPPGGGVNADGFSVRWTGTPTFAAGSHVFTTTSDDGVRLFVDGVALIDQWHDQGATTYTASQTLTPGVHLVRMEYFENGGAASAELSWSNFGDPSASGDTCPAGQFRAEYFNNLLMAGAPALSRCETAIDHDFGTGSPGPGVNVDGFSVRWTGSPVFTAGSHLFTATADDGVRVYVDGALLIDQWKDQAPATYTALRTLTGGAHPVRVEYYENGGGALVDVSWAVT